MVICGIKFTHDGGIALIDGNRLVFSYEIEKLRNMARHSNFEIEMSEVVSILSNYGYRFDDVDEWVFDGWGKEVKPGNEFNNSNHFTLELGDKNNLALQLAGYGNLVQPGYSILTSSQFYSPAFNLNYSSYMHVSGHVASAYCSSPFANQGESSFVLIWDGGMPPQLFYYDVHKDEVSNLGPLFYLIGHIYVSFPHQFAPWNKYEKHLSIAGKVMAFIALGTIRPEIVDKLKSIYLELSAGLDENQIELLAIPIITESFIHHAKKYSLEIGAKTEDILASFHYFLQELLVEHLERKVNQYSQLTKNLCFAGGCGLNIKWNSRIRNTGLFENIWVPPFPNDSGSAIGTACCAMMCNTPYRSLDWTVYSGPSLVEHSNLSLSSYESYSCSIADLARLLHELDEPVVFLNGRAELGPRALGNRSILAPATSLAVKDRLNEIKIREWYRPVAPICLEEYAQEVFTPGTPDPYMLFEHTVNKDWLKRAPAICHLDGTSRIQTVNRNDNAAIHQLITHYYQLSGVPLLCNTSANYKGSGFFPDLKSALEWGRANFVWSNNILYSKHKEFDPQSFFVKNNKSVYS